LEDKKLILGVAFGWGSRKGYDDFLALSSMLDETYRIVLVGVTKKQQKHLPPSVIGICKTNSKQKLAEIYSACDVFVNLTYEDNYPTVNLEARACGLPVITYRTGGSAESAGADAKVVDTGDINAVLDAIVSLPQKGS
jgi:glycosyltransferase involved in cell wall biosynthesis